MDSRSFHLVPTALIISSKIFLQILSPYGAGEGLVVVSYSLFVINFDLYLSDFRSYGLPVFSSRTYGTFLSSENSFYKY